MITPNKRMAGPMGALEKEESGVPAGDPRSGESGCSAQNY